MPDRPQLNCRDQECHNSGRLAAVWHIVVCIGRGFVAAAQLLRRRQAKVPIFTPDHLRLGNIVRVTRSEADANGFKTNDR